MYHGAFFDNSTSLEDSKTAVLNYAARGQKDLLEQEIYRFINHPESLKELFLNRGTFTDYSGRTYTCSFFEYLYWAKDENLCNSVLKFMDAEVKERILERCTAIEEQGLTYIQNNTAITGSKHFDLNPYFNALSNYVAVATVHQERSTQVEKGIFCDPNADQAVELHTAFLGIGLTQKELPVNFVNELCRKDCMLSISSTVNRTQLPRTLSVYDDAKMQEFNWFPLTDSNKLGIDSAIIASNTSATVWNKSDAWWLFSYAEKDLIGMQAANQYRDNSLPKLLEQLNETEPNLANHQV